MRTWTYGGSRLELEVFGVPVLESLSFQDFYPVIDTFDLSGGDAVFEIIEQPIHVPDQLVSKFDQQFSSAVSGLGHVSKDTKFYDSVLGRIGGSFSPLKPLPDGDSVRSRRLTRPLRTISPGQRSEHRRLPGHLSM